MSVLDFGPESNGNWWNYSDQNKPGYSPVLEGTVVKMFAQPHLNYVTKQPETWPNGEPKYNIAVTIQDTNNNQFNWSFKPNKNSGAGHAICEALESVGLSTVRELYGMYIRVTTQDGNYNQAHPRPWKVEVLGQGKAQLLGIEDENSVQVKKPQPSTQPAPQVQQQAAPAPAPAPAPQESRLDQMIDQTTAMFQQQAQQQQAPAYDPNYDAVPYEDYVQ